MKDYKLFLDAPAKEWEMGTPIGNGYTGAMIYGGTARERVQLSEEYIWSGEKMDTDDTEFRTVIDNIRKMLLEGKAGDADEYAEKALDGKFHVIASQETAGELVLDFGDVNENDVTGYRRELNLNKAVASVEFASGGYAYKREFFASYPDHVICMKLSCSPKSSLSFRAYLERYDKNIEGEKDMLLNVDSITNPDDSSLSMTAHTMKGRHSFHVMVKFVNVGGTIAADGNNITVKNADSCCVFINIATEKQAVLPEEMSWDYLLKRHIADFEPIISRSDITLGEDTVCDKPVSARLDAMKQGKDDPNLVSTYYQFGKYLLISSSRPGTLPAHLQGVWNDYIYAPWNADYHTNINLQMNYWHAEVANIPECEEPLNDYINSYLLESGKRVAEVNYKCRGTVLHHLSDIYGFAAPADGLWGLWPMGGAWLSYHPWEHYLYGLDKEYFDKNGYTYLRECARFFLDYMFEDEKGRLLSGPSTSPENRYMCNGKASYLCLSPTMDIEIISGMLENFISAARLVGKDEDMIAEAENALSKMPPLRVGKHGQLMEWMEDYDEKEPGHRHISHAFGLYPAGCINEDKPELFKAVAQTLKRRLSFGGGHTGWSAAWLISLHARLKDRKGVHDMIHKLLTKSTRDSLLDFHPPFQIDGNFGGAAGIAEMVLQSHENCISLIPALPEQYGNGSFEGLRARGGCTVDCKWVNSAVTAFTLKGVPGREYTVKMNGRYLKAVCDAEGTYTFQA